MDDPTTGRAAPPAEIAPDTKDWTWTLERTCPDCGLAAGTIPASELSARVTACTDPWSSVLARSDARVRPEPSTWSPLEYACHVRDVCALFTDRLTLLRAGDGPTFENWDQDRTATEQRYAEQDPATVAGQLAAAAQGLSSAFAGVPDDAWSRSGTRSDGSPFTVLTLGRYGLHDLAHHLWDVGVDVP